MVITKLTLLVVDKKWVHIKYFLVVLKAQLKLRIGFLSTEKDGQLEIRKYIKWTFSVLDFLMKEILVMRVQENLIFIK